MTEALEQVLEHPAVSVIGTSIGVAVVGLWLAAAWWAYADAARRTGSIFPSLVAAGWIVMSTPLLMPLALAVYTLARPQQTAAQRRARRMAESLLDELGSSAEADACPGCAGAVDATWLRCPACATWLATPCRACGSWSDRTLEACPWCGAEERQAPAVEPAAPAVEPAAATAAAPVADPGFRGRRIRRPIRAVGPGQGRPDRPPLRPSPDARPVSVLARH
jgi:hypothetical protein